MLNLILLTSPVNFAGEHEHLEEMFEKFPFQLHVRKPGFSEGQLEKFLLGLNEEIRSMAVLHGSRDMAEAFGLAGFALPATHLELAAPPCGLKHFAWCRSLEELSAAPKVDGAILYPVFDSYTDIEAKGKFAGVSVGEFGNRGIAAGGVDEDRFGELQKLGYAGAAICGAVWNYADPLPAWNRICRKNMMCGF